MSAPNKFSNFFNDPSKVAQNFKPPPAMIAAMLLALTCENKTWYKDDKLRLIVSAATADMGMTLMRMKENGEECPIDQMTMGFIMLLVDLLTMTRDKYGSAEEKRMWSEDEDMDQI